MVLGLAVGLLHREHAHFHLHVLWIGVHHWWLLLVTLELVHHGLHHVHWHHALVHHVLHLPVLHILHRHHAVAHHLSHHLSWRSLLQLIISVSIRALIAILAESLYNPG